MIDSRWVMVRSATEYRGLILRMIAQKMGHEKQRILENY